MKSHKRIRTGKLLYEAYPDIPNNVLERLNRSELNNRSRCRQKNNKRKARGETYLITIEKINFIQICVDQDWKCALCGEPMDYNIMDGMDPDCVSLEHLIGLARGGHHTFENIAGTHRRCNMKKNDEIDNPDAARCKRKAGGRGSQVNKRKKRGHSSIKSQNTLSGEAYKRQKAWGKKTGKSQWPKRELR